MFICQIHGESLFLEFLKNDMVYIDFPFAQPQRLSFYLAAEEYVARYRKEDECFFMWQVSPTVIVGRNQLLEAEVNLPYCREHGIDVVRRKSGGGCVYADMNNIMFSYINTGQNVTYTFDKYIKCVVDVLRSLNVPAETSGRNDILVDGLKVSGNAFYHLPGRNIVHGTMLYDTDIENMVGSITPSEQKLISKGIKSVRQHIALLKDYLSLSLDDFKDCVKARLCQSRILLEPAEIRKIRDIELEYADENYFLGNNPKYALVRKGRIGGCGDLELRIDLKGHTIRSVSLSGDFFPIGDLDKGFLPQFRGVSFDRMSLERLLDSVDVAHFLRGLTNKALLDFLFDKHS